MATQARRGGSRRRRGTDESGATPPPAIEPIGATVAAPVAAALTTDDAELADDRTVAITGSHRGMSLRRSLPGAIVGTLLVVGIAFGAAGPGGAFGPKGDVSKGAAVADARDRFVDERDDGTGSDGADQVGKDAEDATDESSDGTGGTETRDDGATEPGADEQPAPDPTKKPEPKPEPKPDPKPEPKPDPAPVEQIAIGLGIKYDHPVIEWGSCAGLDFDYYKVVRSKDSTVAWPTGDNDALAAVVERGGERRAWDKDAPHGMKVWYRVFCVRKTEAGYKVLNSSVAKGIWVPEETPPPDPITLALEANVNDDGKVVLDWSACQVDGFAFYKVVRSTWNENPSYLPWTDGTDVIGVIESVGTTELLTWAPDAGQTAWYRVQCLGYVGGQKVLLGQSGVVSVATP